MKTVVRVFLFMSLLILATFAQNVPVAAHATLRLPVTMSTHIRHAQAIRATRCDEPGARVNTLDQKLLPEPAFFETESEDNGSTESNFAKKLAAVTGLQSGRFDAIVAAHPVYTSRCSPVCGHFSCKAPRFIRLRVIRI